MVLAKASNQEHLGLVQERKNADVASRHWQNKVDGFESCGLSFQMESLDRRSHATLGQTAENVKVFAEDTAARADACSIHFGKTLPHVRLGRVLFN